MTQDQHSIEGLMALISEYGHCRWSEGSSSATHLDHMGEQRSREEAADLYKQIESYAAHLQQRPLPVREGSADSRALVQAIAGHIDGWRSATFGWQGDADPAKAESNKQRAIQAHAAECMRRISAVFAPSLPVREEPTDEHLESLIENSDGHWKEDVFCIGGPELMELLRAASSPSVQNMGEGETPKDGVDVPVRSGWLPIATAPKDGTRYIAASEYSGHQQIMNQPPNHYPGDWELIDGEWRGEASGFVATHWKPLDPAPGVGGTDGR